MPPHLKRFADILSGLALGAVGAWLLFGNPPTLALVIIVVVAGVAAWGPRLREARRRRPK